MECEIVCYEKNQMWCGERVWGTLGVVSNKKSEKVGHPAYACCARASLPLVPESQTRASWEQLRAGLRRKEDYLCDFYGMTSQALLAYARASLDAQSCPDTCLLRVDAESFVMKRIRCGAAIGVDSHPQAKAAKDGHPRYC